MIHLPEYRFAFAALLSLLLFAGCRQKPVIVESATPDSLYIKSAELIVSRTNDTLRNSLLRAIATSGFDGAVGFCSGESSGLSRVYADTVVLRRTSLRCRNPRNNPDELETRTLLQMMYQLKSEGRADPKLVRDDAGSGVHYFKPIVMQQLCLNCHGKPGREIDDRTMSALKQRYPRDKTVNYRMGDLRGVWHIAFPLPPADRRQPGTRTSSPHNRR